MVRRSACWGSKSVDARTISSPTRQPAAFRTSIEVLPASAVLASLVQVFFPITVQVQGSAHEHDPAVNGSFVPPTPLISSSLTLLVKVIVALRVWGWLFSTNLQLPVQHDPLGGQFKIFIVCEAQFAVDRQTAQRRRTDIEDNVHVLANGDKRRLRLAPFCLPRWPDQTSVPL